VRSPTVVGPEIPTIEFQSENSPERLDAYEQVLDQMLGVCIQQSQGTMVQAQLIVQQDAARAGEMLRLVLNTLRDQRKFGLQVVRQ
jgi:hypothetical protein